MRIELNSIGKRFNREWIFRNVTLQFETDTVTGIVGPNGSGKSTLLQCISGYLTTTSGSVQFQSEKGTVEPEQVFRQISMATPYLDQEEWLTLREAIVLQNRFKPFRKERKTEEILELSGLKHAADKYIRQFSSGMKQRARLSLAILADTDVLLLDEPASNLDKQGVEWFTELLQREKANRTVIICSNNHPDELAQTERQIDLSQFKPIG